MNFKKCHKREGFLALDTKLRSALSVPLKYVTLGGTTVFAELHSTVKHHSVKVTEPCLHRKQNLNYFFFYLSIWMLDKMSEVVAQHTKLVMLHLCFWVPIAGQGCVISYMTWAHSTWFLHFLTSPLNLLLPKNHHLQPHIYWDILQHLF